MARISQAGGAQPPNPTPPRVTPASAPSSGHEALLQQTPTHRRGAAHQEYLSACWSGALSSTREGKAGPANSVNNPPPSPRLGAPALIPSPASQGAACLIDHLH